MDKTLSANPAPSDKKKIWQRKGFKITIFRMWVAGAVCFFGGWGRTGALEVGALFSLQLIVSLIAVMVMADFLIVNPLIRLTSGRKIIDNDNKNMGWRIFIGLPLHITRVTLLMLLIVQTYYFLNVFFIRALGIDEQYVPVPLEPILFGIMYGLYYFVFETFLKFVAGRVFPALSRKLPRKENS